MLALPLDVLPWFLYLLAALLYVAFCVCAVAEFRGWSAAHRDVAAPVVLPVDDGPLDPPYSFASDTLDAVRERIR